MLNQLSEAQLKSAISELQVILKAKKAESKKAKMQIAKYERLFSASIKGFKITGMYINKAGETKTINGRLSGHYRRNAAGARMLNVYAGGCWDIALERFTGAIYNTKGQITSVYQNGLNMW